MKALGSSYLRAYVSRERVANSSADFAPRMKEFSFHGNQKRVGDGLVLRAVSTAAPIQNNLETEGIQTLNSDHSKTVRVRFRLQKQCAFGQQFLVVGDDPNLGLWDPSDGVALDWSEGHIWTAEVDIACGKVINYKFILKELDGTVSWQPGSDRVLETWETDKTISVSEYWDSPELQNIVEEGDDDLNGSGLNGSDSSIVEDLNGSALNGSDSLIVENLNRIVVEEWNDVMDEEVDANERVDDNIDVELGEQDLSLRDEECDLSTGLQNEVGLVVDYGPPVLVPGLAPIPPEEEFESEELNVCDEVLEVTTNVFDEIEKNDNIVEDATTKCDEAESTTEFEIESKTSEMVVVEEEEEPRFDEEIEMVGVEEKPRFDEEIEMGSNILDNNMQWGRQRLHKFLANLGLMRHS